MHFQIHRIFLIEFAPKSGNIAWTVNAARNHRKKHGRRDCESATHANTWQWAADSCMMHVRVCVCVFSSRTGPHSSRVPVDAECSMWQQHARGSSSIAATPKGKKLSLALFQRHFHGFNLAYSILKCESKDWNCHSQQQKPDARSIYYLYPPLTGSIGPRHGKPRYKTHVRLCHKWHVFSGRF